ncbi:MAG: tetratricopeptide repeat protein [Verrucomicrobia bacterium]|nr:tetratricopeptide repeat protein [Verrucomicrobiota bacterium]
MLTFFTTCKPFTGAAAVLQRNAIESWRRIGRGCDIILVGDDAGTAEIAAEFGLRHAPKVERNEYGTPLLNSLFDTAQAMARHDVLCYLNADIMLMGDFMDAVRKLPPERLLMISRRWNVDVGGPWNFDEPEWERYLREHARSCGYQKSILGGPDFFVFRRGQWRDIPPFALGRTAFDNWLIYAALVRGYPVVDASACVMAIHQNHDCGHADGGWTGAWFGEEAVRNRALAADGSQFYNFLDATHAMTAGGLEPAMGAEHMARRVERRQAKWFDRQLFLAGTLKKLGRHDEALAVVKEAGRAAGTPDRVRRYVRARIEGLVACGRAGEIEPFVTRLIAAEPSPLMAYHLASICEDLGVYDTAIALFDAIADDESAEAAKIRPGATYHLARIAAENGDDDRARECAQRCLDADPAHLAARAILDRLEQERQAGEAFVEGIRDLTPPRAAAPAQAPPAVRQPADAVG